MIFKLGNLKKNSIYNNIAMPKTQNSSTRKRVKNIKNIYIHKIHSLFKLMGDDQQAQQLSCLNNARRTVSAGNKQGWILQKRQNNKDAARKARLRKKIYMELLEQIIQKFQKLNQEAKQLQKSSNQLLAQLTKQGDNKCQDQIGQYLMQPQNQKNNKYCSQATMDQQKQSKLNKIVTQIQRISFPKELSYSGFQNSLKNMSNCSFIGQVNKIQSAYEQIPQLFSQLKNVCQDHATLHVLSTKEEDQAYNQCNYDPYIGKTLLQKYFSKTLCKKNVSDIQIHKYLDNLTKMQSFCFRVDQIDP